MYLSMIVCIYVSCAFGRGFETHHLHKDDYLKYGGDWIWQSDKDIKRSIATTGEQVEYAMAA